MCERFEIRRDDGETNIGDRPADVRRVQVEGFLRGRRVAPEPEITAEHHERDLRAGEEVRQIVVGPDSVPGCGSAVARAVAGEGAPGTRRSADTRPSTASSAVGSDPSSSLS